MTKTPDVWRIEIVVPGLHVAFFEEVLEGFADSVVWYDPKATENDDIIEPDYSAQWTVQAYCTELPERPAVMAALTVAAAAAGIDTPQPDITRVEQYDWVNETLRNFPPITAGRFFVHGSHYEGGVPAGSIGLTVDAGTAFGSGEHATTWGCLTALHDLAKRRRFSNPLDVGCGSGILAMAMAKLWARPVLAVDIDPESVRVTRENLRLNQVGRFVRAEVSDGLDHRLVPMFGPYDIVTANILARPLVSMAPQIAANLAPGGVVILSGLLARSERMVLGAFQAQGLSLVRRYPVNGWNTLVVSR